MYEDLFKKDREGNQGEFAETIRDQFVQEREEFLQKMDEMLAEADTEAREEYIYIYICAMSNSNRSISIYTHSLFPCATGHRANQPVSSSKGPGDARPRV